MKLRSIEAILLHGHFYLKHTFVDGVNIIYGDNGGGKTTLLHILTNLLNGNFNRFAFLDFSSIEVDFEDGNVLSIKKYPMDIYGDEIIEVTANDKPIANFSVTEIVSNLELINEKYTGLTKYQFPQVIYLPAYRILYDYLNLATPKIFDLLSGFSPLLYFPSLIEIEEKLKKDALLKNIPKETISFVENLNKFLTNKKLLLNNGKVESPFEIAYNDGFTSNQLTTLSSGERQIISIIYAVSQSAQNSIVLIDEPEISLHVEWQRKILKIIDSMFNTEQIIACTHSPVIGADYELSELEFRFVGN